MLLALDAAVVVRASEGLELAVPDDARRSVRLDDAVLAEDHPDGAVDGVVVIEVAQVAVARPHGLEEDAVLLLLPQLVVQGVAVAPVSDLYVAPGGGRPRTTVAVGFDAVDVAFCVLVGHSSVGGGSGVVGPGDRPRHGAVRHVHPGRVVVRGHGPAAVHGHHLVKGLLVLPRLQLVGELIGEQLEVTIGQPLDDQQHAAQLVVHKDLVNVIQGEELVRGLGGLEHIVVLTPHN